MLKNRWTFLKGFNSNLPTVSRPSFTASSTFLQQLPLLSIKTLDGGLGSICPQVVLSSLSAICCPTLAKPTPLSGQWVWATVAADHRDLRTKENVLPPPGAPRLSPALSPSPFTFSHSCFPPKSNLLLAFWKDTESEGKNRNLHGVFRRRKTTVSCRLSAATDWP